MSRFQKKYFLKFFYIYNIPVLETIKKKMFLSHYSIFFSKMGLLTPEGNLKKE